MNLKKIQIELEVSEIERILAIDLDGNEKDALAFIRETLSRKVKKALQRH